MPFIGNRPDKVEHFLKLSLEALKLDYVDLYLIHLPVGFVGKNDKDLYPVDENRRAILDKTTDLVALWKVIDTINLEILMQLLNCIYCMLHLGNGISSECWSSKSHRSVQL